MAERTGVVMFQGNPLTLVGEERKTGDRAPDFTVQDHDLKTVTLKDFAGKVMVLSAVPSLDTPVCDRETRRFGKEAEGFGPDVVMATISMDLPFAQSRWCMEHDVSNIKMLSDHREASFGLGYGILVKELRLLARAVFIVDRESIIRYIQLVPEIGREPDYDAVLVALRGIV